jgi:integrase
LASGEVATCWSLFFQTEEETTALVAAPNPCTWIGRRDKAVLLVAVQTGLRNSEITSLRRQEVAFGTGAHVRCLGKGRKMLLRCQGLRTRLGIMAIGLAEHLQHIAAFVGKVSSCKRM